MRRRNGRRRPYTAFVIRNRKPARRWCTHITDLDLRHRTDMPDTRLLHTHRQSLLYLERSRVRVDEDRVVYDVADDSLIRSFNVPHANLSALLLGQGTSITQAAMRKLCEENVMLAATGSGATPLLMASFGDLSRPTDRFQKWLTIYQDERRSLEAAKIIQLRRIEALEKLAQKNSNRFDPDWIDDAADRFRKTIKTTNTADSLLGAEGTFCKSIYHAIASGYRIKGFKRVHGRESDRSHLPERIQTINAFLDHGNYLAYGIAAVALWAYGIPPALSVLHGRSRAGGLVFDIADSFKDAFVLVLACDIATRNPNASEKDLRGRVIGAFDDRKLMERTFRTIDDIIAECAQP